MFDTCSLSYGHLKVSGTQKTTKFQKPITHPESNNFVPKMIEIGERRVLSYFHLPWNAPKLPVQFPRTDGFYKRKRYCSIHNRNAVCSTMYFGILTLPIQAAPDMNMITQISPDIHVR